jgi:uncharacterized protein YlxW (UPF0749 family)
MTESETIEKWLPIVQYAEFKNISITSVRRYIKASRVKYKKINGKYFVLARNFQFKETTNNKKINDLEDKIKRLQEENQELKMLISVYEKRLEH